MSHKVTKGARLPRLRLHRQYLALKRYTPAVHRCHGCARRAAFFLCDEAGNRLPKCFGGYCHSCAPRQPIEEEVPFILGFDDETAPLMTLLVGGVTR